MAQPVDPKTRTRVEARRRRRERLDPLAARPKIVKEAPPGERAPSPSHLRLPGLVLEAAVRAVVSGLERAEVAAAGEVLGRGGAGGDRLRRPRRDMRCRRFAFAGRKRKRLGKMRICSLFNEQRSD
jgi:hypothetical protein